MSGDECVAIARNAARAEKIHAHGGVGAERNYRGVGHLTLIGTFAPALRVLGASAPRDHSIRLALHTAGRFVNT